MPRLPRQLFEVNICNYTLYTWLGFAGMMAAVALAAGAVTASGLPKGNGQFGLLLAVGGSGFYGVYRLLRNVTVRPALLTVEPDCLTLHHLPDGPTTHLAFAEVVAYRDEWLRDGRELRFRLQSGRKLKVAVNTFLGPVGDYEELVQAVRQAAIPFQQRSPGLMGREKSFFEKPVATVLLVVCSAVMLLAIGAMLFGHKPFHGSLLGAVACWLSYVGMWRAGRANRLGQSPMLSASSSEA